MGNSGTAGSPAELTRAAAACRANVAAGTFESQSPAFDEAVGPLLHAIRDSHERFAFDREGRPGAIEAVRQALPAVERDLFDAVIEDHACEVAALREALCQVVRATPPLPDSNRSPVATAAALPGTDRHGGALPSTDRQ